MFIILCNQRGFFMIAEVLKNIGFADWVIDAVCDSFAVLPFLFVIFLLVEFFEFYFSDKVNRFMKTAKRTGPLIGSTAAIIPQCGFSVIASTLYVRKFITKGTLIAIYLATSDEAIPVLLSNPEAYHYVFPVILTKLLIAIPAGYLVDFIFKQKESDTVVEVDVPDEVETGCCKHELLTHHRKELWIHPLKHTIHTFIFILLITLILNYFISVDFISTFYSSNITAYKIIQPVVTALIGLIPNCAVSIAITLMLIKGTISFGAAMAGLMSNAGLGFLVLLRINKFKDTFKLISALLVISIICGIILQFV